MRDSDKGQPHYGCPKRIRIGGHSDGSPNIFFGEFPAEKIIVGKMRQLIGKIQIFVPRRRMKPRIIKNAVTLDFERRADIEEQEQTKTGDDKKRQNDCRFCVFYRHWRGVKRHDKRRENNYACGLSICNGSTLLSPPTMRTTSLSIFLNSWYALLYILTVVPKCPPSFCKNSS